MKTGILQVILITNEHLGICSVCRTTVQCIVQHSIVSLQIN